MRGAAGSRPVEEPPDSFSLSEQTCERALGSFMVLVFNVFNVIAVASFIMYYKDTNWRFIITSSFHLTYIRVVYRNRGLLDIFSVLPMDVKSAF